MPRVALLRHASSACEAVSAVEVEARFGAPDELILEYSITGTMTDLCIPAVRAPCRADELWRHTCFEAFVGGPGEGYLEINLSPSTEWAAYRFDAYRQGMAPASLVTAPVVVVRRAAERLGLSATLRLPAPEAAAALSTRRLALAAVIEDAGGRLSWWALAHPAAKPDFHHPQSFVWRS